MTLTLGWFTAGRGPGSRGMLERTLAAIDDGSLDARIEFVFMHRERGEGDGSDAFMDLVESRGIPLVRLSSLRFRRERGGDFDAHREAYDGKVLELLRPFGPDLCVLAGYLLIMSPALGDAFTFINLHPALPDGPIGLWQKVIWELIETKATESGITTFLVTQELDLGPRATFVRYPIRGPAFDALWADVKGKTVEELKAGAGEQQPLFRAIREAGVRREPIVLVETLKAFARGDVAIANDGPPSPRSAKPLPLDLTPLAEAQLTANGP